MSFPITIRTASPLDAPAISHLISLLGSSLGDPSPVTPEYAAAALRRETCEVLLAERGGSAVGMLSYHFHPSLYHAADSCLIDELVIEPATRGQGLGALLLGEVVRRAHERGCVEVALSVLTANEDARRFYERHGFEADAVYMERHLTCD